MQKVKEKPLKKNKISSFCRPPRDNSAFLTCRIKPMMTREDREVILCCHPPNDSALSVALIFPTPEVRKEREEGFEREREGKKKQSNV